VEQESQRRHAVGWEGAGEGEGRDRGDVLQHAGTPQWGLKAAAGRQDTAMGDAICRGGGGGCAPHVAVGNVIFLDYLQISYDGAREYLCC
jgi:hypothetical protein